MAAQPKHNGFRITRTLCVEEGTVVIGSTDGQGSAGRKIEQTAGIY